MSKIGYIDITGIISKEDYSDPFFGGGHPTASASSVQEQINANKDAEELVVSINSEGGSCDEGFAIYNILRNSGKKITTRAVGTCASIASIIFLAGSKREIFGNTQIMIHLPMIQPWESLNETEIDRIKNQLVQEKERILNEYVNVTGADRSTLEQYMVDETYIKSDQAIELKFATEIIKPVMAIANKFKNMKNKTLAAKAVQALAQLLNVADTTNVDMTTTDGKILSIDPAVEVGATVMMDGADAPDGIYELENGQSIDVTGGKIVTITDPASNDKDEEIANLKTQIETLTNENTTLKTTNEELSTKVTNIEAENAAIATKVDGMVAHLKTLNVDFKAIPAPVFGNQKKDEKPTFDAAEEKRRKAEFKAKKR